MAALLSAPLRTPSPKVRIRSQSFSFDSPSSISRLATSTPLSEAPFSKSTGCIDVAKTVPQHHVLLPLKTKMSNDSLSDSMSESTASSPTSSEHSTTMDDLPPGNLLGLFVNTCPPRPEDALYSHPPHKRARLSPPHITLAPVSETVASGPTSPFAFQDTAFPMTSPWLVRVVLDLHDVHGVCWMDIPEAVMGAYGAKTGSAEVLEILSGNGRVKRTWWD